MISAKILITNFRQAKTQKVANFVLLELHHLKILNPYSVGVNTSIEKLPLRYR